MEKKKRDTNPDLEKLIEVFKSGDKNEINGYLAKTPLNLDTLNEDAKDKYNRESLLHLALKYKNTIRFFQTVLNHDPKYLMEQRSICDKELKKEDKQNSFKTPPEKMFCEKRYKSIPRSNTPSCCNSNKKYRSCRNDPRNSRKREIP